MSRKNTPASITENDVFAKNLRDRMKECSENQSSLAEKIGVQRQTISLYTTGQSKPDTEKLSKISKALNVSSDWLIGLTEVKSADTSVKSICESTGLSEKAIEKAMLWASGDPPIDAFTFRYTQSLSELIECPRFKQVLKNVSRAISLSLLSRQKLVIDDNLTGKDLCSAENTLLSVGQFCLPMEDASAFYAQQAANCLLKVIEDIVKPEEVQNGEHQED